jgi:hypothetical protein
MALTKNRFYFGPAGDLQIVPSFPTGGAPSPSPVLYGSVTRSLTGVPTMVNYGSKRTWPLQWIQMTELQARFLARFESAYRQRILRRYFMLDTRNTNYLSPDASACAAEDPVGVVFNWSAGLVPVRTNTGTFHTDLSGQLDGYVTHAAAAIGTSLETRRQTPVLAGSSMLFSGYFSGSGSIQLTFFFYDSQGAFLSALISGTTTVLSGTTTGTVAQFLLTTGFVPVGAASFGVGYKTTTLNANINFNGFMVQMDEATRPAIGWFPGRGGAEVICSAFTVSYPRFDKHQITATLEEV